MFTISGFTQKQHIQQVNVRMDKVWKLFRPQGQVQKLALGPRSLMMRVNQFGSIVIYFRGTKIGRIYDGGKLYLQSPEPELSLVRQMLIDLEADPLLYVTQYGQTTGTCCVCSRTLTDEISKKRGIGPICEKFFGSRR